MYKYVAVVNRKMGFLDLMHGLVRATAQVAKLSHPAKSFVNYIDKNGKTYPNISEQPFIVLRAKNSNQLKTLYDHFNGSDDCLVEKYEAIENDFVAVSLFGDENDLNDKTKKFSVFNSADDRDISTHGESHQDTLVIVLDPSQSKARLMNAVGHLIAGSMRQSNAEAFNVVIKQTTSEETFRQLKDRIAGDADDQDVEQNISYAEFLDTMIEGGSDVQVQKTSETPTSEVRHYAMSFFTTDQVANQLMAGLSFSSSGDEKSEEDFVPPLPSDNPEYPPSNSPIAMGNN